MLSINRFRALLLTLGSASIVTCRAQQPGVVYYNFGGLSGRGIGEVHLATNGTVTEFHYQKPLHANFRGDNCNDPGAMWTVTVQTPKGGGPQLSGAACDGKLDEKIHGSWLVVRQYLDLMAKGSAEQAAALVFSEWKATGEYRAYRTALNKLDFSGYRDFGGSGRCVAVLKSLQTGQTQLEAGPDCLLTGAGGPLKLTFWVARDAAGQRWTIDRITSGTL